MFLFAFKVHLFWIRFRNGSPKFAKFGINSEQKFNNPSNERISVAFFLVALHLELYLLYFHLDEYHCLILYSQQLLI